MTVLSGKARTAETYLAGLGVSGALTAGAVVVFLLLVGLVSFDVFPRAAGLIGGGDGSESADPAAPADAAAKALGPSTDLVTNAATGAPLTGEPGKALGGGGTGIGGGPNGTGAPVGSGGGGAGSAGGGGSSSPGLGDTVNNTANGVGNTVDGVGNTVDGVGNTVDGVGNGVGNTVDGLGKTVNNTVDGLGGALNGLTGNNKKP